MKNKSLSWNDRLALINHYKPTDEQACTAFEVSKDELNTARQLASVGTFNPSKSDIDIKAYSNLFATSPNVVSVKRPTDDQSTVTKITKEKPETASRIMKEPKKRGRKTDKIAKAFSAIPEKAVSLESFAKNHNVSVAVLRQSKRFDTIGTGTVFIRKDKESKQLMIWRTSK